MFSFIVRQNIPFIWRNKKLWLLGIFTSFLGATEETELLLNILIPNRKNILEFFQQLYETNLFTKEGLQSAYKHITQEPAAFLPSVIMLIITFGVMLFLVWLSLIAQGAIISASVKAKQGPINSALAYLKEGEKRFWQILGINLISKVIIAGLFIVLSYPITKNIAFSIFLLLVFIFLASILYIIMKLAILIVVIEKKKLFFAIKAAYTYFYNHWKIASKLLLTLLIFTILGIFLSLISISLLYIPFFFMAEASMILTITIAPKILFLLYLLSATVLLILFFGFLSSISWISWTHLYQKIKK